MRTFALSPLIRLFVCALIFAIGLPATAFALSPLPWYGQTDGPFFIAKITSIESADGRPEFNHYKAELFLLHPADRISYSGRKNFYIEKKYSEELAIGDTLLIELRPFGLDSFRAREIRGNLQMLPIKDRKLIFTEQYISGAVFPGIKEYINFRKSKNIHFYEGMDVDEIKTFFNELSRYRKEYVGRLLKKAPR